MASSSRDTAARILDPPLADVARRQPRNCSTNPVIPLRHQWSRSAPSGVFRHLPRCFTLPLHRGSPGRRVWPGQELLHGGLLEVALLSEISRSSPPIQQCIHIAQRRRNGALFEHRSAEWGRASWSHPVATELRHAPRRTSGDGHEEAPTVRTVRIAPKPMRGRDFGKAHPHHQIRIDEDARGTVEDSCCANKVQGIGSLDQHIPRLQEQS